MNSQVYLITQINNKTMMKKIQKKNLVATDVTNHLTYFRYVVQNVIEFMVVNVMQFKNKKIKINKLLKNLKLNVLGVPLYGIN